MYNEIFFSNSLKIVSYQRFHTHIIQPYKNNWLLTDAFHSIFRPTSENRLGMCLFSLLTKGLLIKFIHGRIHTTYSYIRINCSKFTMSLPWHSVVVPPFEWLVNLYCEYKERQFIKYISSLTEASK